MNQMIVICPYQMEFTFLSKCFRLFSVRDFVLMLLITKSK